MTDEEYAGIIRSMIEHENELINHRLTWMAAFQGLLVAAIGFAWGKETLLVLLICALGLGFGISTGRVLWSSQRAIRSLLHDWRARPKCSTGYDGPRVIGSPGKSGYWWLHPWYFFPWFMMVFWLILASVEIAILYQVP